MNKTELKAKILELDGLTNDEKSALVELLNKQKKYGLVWEEKPEDVETRLLEELPILTEVKERAIISNDKNAPNHILIEGDNLEALTALTYSHAGKIDFIYIDPPYNTGNKDFVYNDSFVESLDSYRHSKWLSFISSRLRVAKLLLSEKGVIFISIDDNEQAQLKLLCDEIFGQSNLLAQIISVSNPGGRDYKQIAIMHEYLLAYANTEESQLNEIEKDIDFNMFDNNGGYELRELRNRNPKFHSGNRPNLFYPFYVNPNKTDDNGCNSVSLSKNQDYSIEVRPYNSAGKESVWRWGQKKTEENNSDNILNANIVARQKRDGGWNIYEKCRKATSKAKSLWDETEMRTEEGTRLMMSIFGKVVFDHPKSLSLLKRCCQLGTNKNSIILDFFAGSGTTLHATMELNKADDGHRQCILITNNENNICEAVTYERNKRIIKGYTNAKGEKVIGLNDNCLRYYKTDFISRKRTIKNMRALVVASTDLLCIKNNLYSEQKTFGGKKLKPQVARYFDDGKTKMLVIYNELAVDAFATMLRDMVIEGKIKVYVFSNNKYAYNDNFEEVLDKIELCALPAAIYDAYNAVLKPMKKDGDENEVFTDNSEFETEQGILNFNEEGGVQ